MNKEEYYTLFSKEKREAALNRVWENRDIEIQIYWKRATYFWTFIAVSLVGYISLITSSSFTELKTSFPQIEYLVINLGLVFSTSWVLVNAGSKRWQNNWENHIKALEDDITGPVYKVSCKEGSYSVTNINFTVSIFVTALWVLLGVRYSIFNLSFNCNKCHIDWIWITTTVMTLAILYLMIFSYGRRKSRSHQLNFIIREAEFKA